MMEGIADIEFEMIINMSFPELKINLFFFLQILKIFSTNTDMCSIETQLYKEFVNKIFVIIMLL